MIELDKTTKNRIAKAMPMLAENQRHKFLGIEALVLGHGGIEELSKFTGTTRSTISLGMKEPAEAESHPKALEALVLESTIGNPENPICWTTKILRNLEAELKSQGYKISHVKVGELL